MFFHYKNKGILIPVYFFVCAIGVAILINVLKIDGQIAIEYEMLIALGISTIAAGFWTYQTRDSYYVANGVKKRMYEDNSFFFIPMEIWAYIFYGGGSLSLLIGILFAMGYLKE